MVRGLPHRGMGSSCNLRSKLPVVSEGARIHPVYAGMEMTIFDVMSGLARDLVDRRGCGVLVLCGPAERQLAGDIATATGRPGVFALGDLVTRAGIGLSIGLTKACVRRADLLVTTDSGPRHFAHAFDRPVVTLFGPTHIAWTETYHLRAIHLQKPVPCGPCQRRTCPLDHRCMKELTPNEVFDAAESLLQGSN